jgi:hypothetical protein
VIKETAESTPIENGEKGVTVEVRELFKKPHSA